MKASITLWMRGPLTSGPLHERVRRAAVMAPRTAAVRNTQPSCPHVYLDRFHSRFGIKDPVGEGVGGPTVSISPSFKTTLYFRTLPSQFGKMERSTCMVMVCSASSSVYVPKNVSVIFTTVAFSSAVPSRRSLDLNFGRSAPMTWSPKRPVGSIQRRPFTFGPYGWVLRPSCHSKYTSTSVQAPPSCCFIC